jgi:hypothetical protein
MTLNTDKETRYRLGRTIPLGLIVRRYSGVPPGRDKGMPLTHLFRSSVKSVQSVVYLFCFISPPDNAKDDLHRWSF